MGFKHETIVKWVSNRNKNEMGFKHEIIIKWVSNMK